MKLSITATENAPMTAPFVLRGAYRDSIIDAAKIGYDAVELHIRRPREMDCTGILDCCRKNGIAVSSLGTGFGYSMDKLSLSSADKDNRLAAIERIKEYTDLAEVANCVVIIGLLRGLARESGGYKEFELRLTESLKTCLDYAEKKNVTLVLEAINHFESDAFQNIEDACGFISKLGTKNLRLHIDSFHMNIEEADLRKSILNAGELIGHVHFADSNRRYPGAGHMDFKQILSALEEVNYQGYIAMECLPYPSPFEAAEKAYNYLKSL